MDGARAAWRPPVRPRWRLHSRIMKSQCSAAGFEHNARPRFRDPRKPLTSDTPVPGFRELGLSEPRPRSTRGRRLRVAVPHPGADYSRDRWAVRTCWVRHRPERARRRPSRCPSSTRCDRERAEPQALVLVPTRRAGDSGGRGISEVRRESARFSCAADLRWAKLYASAEGTGSVAPT